MMSARIVDRISPRWLILPLVFLGYFSLSLIPRWRPQAAATPAFLFYVLSLALAIGFLVIGLLVCGASAAWSTVRGRPLARHLRPLLVSIIASIGCAAAVLIASRVIARQLP